MKNAIKKTKKLTLKQEKFIQEYLKNKNGTQSVKKAGYKVKNNDSAAALAKKLLSNPLIKKQLKEYLKNEEITTEWIVKELKKHAMRGKPQYKLKALELLGKYLGMFQNNINLKGKVEIEQSFKDLVLKANKAIQQNQIKKNKKVKKG